MVVQTKFLLIEIDLFLWLINCAKLESYGSKWGKDRGALGTEPPEFGDF